ncbi:alpha/beta hydrolase [Streptomyces sp. M19]
MEREDDHARRRVDSELVEQRGLLSLRPAPGRPLSWYIPYRTSDGCVALRAWYRPAHAEADALRVSGDTLTVHGTLHGTEFTAAPPHRARRRPRGRHPQLHRRRGGPGPHPLPADHPVRAAAGRARRRARRVGPVAAARAGRDADQDRPPHRRPRRAQEDRRPPTAVLDSPAARPGCARSSPSPTTWPSAPRTSWSPSDPPRPYLERVLFCVALVTTLLAGTPSSAPGRRRGGGRARRAVVRVRGDTRQRLTAYWRTGPGRHPGIVLLHGGYPYDSGGWTARARRLAHHGYAVFDVDYRLDADAPWSAQRADVLRALGWIARKADGFRLDPRRIVVLGSSAGGHLATSLAAPARAVGGSGVVALSPAASPYRSAADEDARCTSWTPGAPPPRPPAPAPSTATSPRRPCRAPPAAPGSSTPRRRRQGAALDRRPRVSRGPAHDRRAAQQQPAADPEPPGSDRLLRASRLRAASSSSAG